PTSRAGWGRPRWGISCIPSRKNRHGFTFQPEGMNHDERLVSGDGDCASDRVGGVRPAAGGTGARGTAPVRPRWVRRGSPTRADPAAISPGAVEPDPRSEEAARRTAEGNGRQTGEAPHARAAEDAPGDAKPVPRPGGTGGLRVQPSARG